MKLFIIHRDSLLICLPVLLCISDNLNHIHNGHGMLYGLANEPQCKFVYKSTHRLCKWSRLWELVQAQFCGVNISKRIILHNHLWNIGIKSINNFWKKFFFFVKKRLKLNSCMLLILIDFDSTKLKTYTPTTDFHAIIAICTEPISYSLLLISQIILKSFLARPLSLLTPNELEATFTFHFFAIQKCGSTFFTSEVIYLLIIYQQ